MFCCVSVVLPNSGIHGLSDPGLGMGLARSASGYMRKCDALYESVSTATGIGRGRLKSAMVYGLGVDADPAAVDVAVVAVVVAANL